MLAYLLPEYREQSDFRYLGRWRAQGNDYFIVAFAQRPEGTQLESHISLGDGRTAPLQGLIWIESATSRVTRIRLDLFGPIQGIPFKTMTTDISLAPVSSQTGEVEFWVPARVTLHAHYAGGVVRSVHRYSDYQLNGSDARPRAAVDTGAEDPWELVDRGCSLTGEGKPGEAIPVFREALRLNPDVPVGEFHLAAALRATGDFAGAEAELRDAVKRVPDSGPVHNLLGILIFKRGDLQGAIAEFRTSARLQPKDATVHFNLAQAFEKSGDRNAALQEYQTAIILSPDNAGFRERYERLKSSASVAAAPGGAYRHPSNVPHLYRQPPLRVRRLGACPRGPVETDADRTGG